MKKIENILLVEDEKLLAKLIELELRDNDYNVIKVDNGLEAITKLECEKIDLVLSDLFMPEIDGIELVKYIKSQNKNIPVIVFSASCHEDIKAELSELGILHFIEKPLDDAKFDLLLSYIESH